MIFIVAKMLNLLSRSVDFVLAFPQAELDIDIYMKLPIGFDQIDGEKYVLKLNRSLYGLKQGSHNWYKKLHQTLIDRDFKPSDIDPCVYYSSNSIIIVYVDDVIIISKKESTLDAIVKSLFEGEEKFNLTDEGSLDKYLGIDIRDLGKDSYELCQPFLIERIIKLVGLEETDKQKRTTPVGKPLLYRNLEGKPYKKQWNYQVAVGMLNHLQATTRPDISMAMHQCVRFCNDPKLSHERALQRIVRYLI